MPRETFAVTVESWRSLLKSLEEHAADSPEISQQRAKLKAMYEQACKLNQERAALEAAKQAATREIRGLLRKGRTTTTHLRSFLKHHYGPQSESLVAFGMQPLRTRPRRKKPVSEE